ncbi:unnamed protein product [Didymodactylos carnosus]|uniref:Uncharacterized protein n=2 Tax=Didymodactylos carnosus TaxID=1234261 RepID=A0A815B9V2_9BILA|nr:unnamed protein product [Didymodactylos carnosus]CAF4058767.1 unnamed protein product [Didymodactylos carnosus]
MQTVIRSDMDRKKTYNVSERRLQENINGPRGLNWQCGLQLQRLRRDERGIERELLRLKLGMDKPLTSPRPCRVKKTSSVVVTTSSFETAKITRSQ